jgi:hypothetical protein
MLQYMLQYMLLQCFNKNLAKCTLYHEMFMAHTVF